MFVSSLVDFLPLLLSPSTYFKICLFLSKLSFERHIQNLQKIPCWLKIWMGFVGPKLIKLWTSPIRVFFSCLCDGHLGIAYANMVATTQWPRACSPPHLTCRVCVLWLPESLMDLSLLCKPPICYNVMVLEWLHNAANNSVSVRPRSQLAKNHGIQCPHDCLAGTTCKRRGTNIWKQLTETHQ